MIDLERLDAAIRESGKTRLYISARLGKPQYFITNIFRRKTDVPDDIKEGLARELGVSVAYLCGETDDKTPRRRVVRVPVYGQVAAGIPIDAITDIEDYEELPESMPADEYAALRIHGDSMEPRILDGDTVIVRLQSTAATGDVAIVIVNGDTATCKRIRRTPDGILLISTNPKYDPIFYSNREIEQLPVTIWGKVVELRGKV